ncbi:DUF1616 domain-containing protein [Thermocladium modestius]|nr:DUF1616 domain-containing protein [Thermocladium modestius]
MKANTLMLLPLIIAAVMAIALIVHAASQPPPPSLLSAYGEVARLGAGGANVTLLVNELNQAINLTSEGEASNASPLINEVLAQLPGARASLNGILASKVIALAAAAAVIAAAALIYAKRREIIGELWLRLRSGDSVRAGPGKPTTLLFNEEVASIVLAILIILVVFITAQSVVSNYSTRFSAIGLLGPGGKLGGYPSTIPVNSSPRLYLYVYNHMGEPVWYVVDVYLINASSQPPVTAPPLLTYERILLNNQSWIAPLSIPSVGEPGSYKLLAELWMYSPSNLTLTYTGEYVQLYFNATVS